MVSHPWLSSFLSFAACYSEFNITLPGNDLNDGLNNKQDSAEACRISCRSVAGSLFFDWVGPTFTNTQYHDGCWCKHSDSGRRVLVGVISGNVNCINVTSKLDYCYSCMSIINPLMYLLYHCISEQDLYKNQSQIEADFTNTVNFKSFKSFVLIADRLWVSQKVQMRRRSAKHLNTHTSVRHFHINNDLFTW